MASSRCAKTIHQYKKLMFTLEQVLDFGMENGLCLSKGIRREHLSIREIPIGKLWEGRGLVRCFSISAPTDPNHLRDGGVDFHRIYETSNGRLAYEDFISSMLNEGQDEPADSLHSSLMRSFGLIKKPATCCV